MSLGLEVLNGDFRPRRNNLLRLGLDLQGLRLHWLQLLRLLRLRRLAHRRDAERCQSRCL